MSGKNYYNVSYMTDDPKHGFRYKRFKYRRNAEKFAEKVLIDGISDKAVLDTHTANHFLIKTEVYD